MKMEILFAKIRSSLCLLSPRRVRSRASAVLGCPQLQCINMQTTVGQDMNFCGIREATAEVADFVPLPPRHEKGDTRTIQNQLTGVVGASSVRDERFVGERAVGSSQRISDEVVGTRPVPASRARQARRRVPGRAEKQVVSTVQRYDLWYLHLREVTWYAHRW